MAIVIVGLTLNVKADFGEPGCNDATACVANQVRGPALSGRAGLPLLKIQR